MAGAASADEARAGPQAEEGFQLAPLPGLPRAAGPLLICVLDGWGEGRWRDQYNAVECAHTPHMDALRASAAHGRWRTLRAHGTAVGLPSDADMGNSEVGAGRGCWPWVRACERD